MSVAGDPPVASILGQSPQLAAALQTLQRVMNHAAHGNRLPPVLLLGETGTGKGLFAREIHRASPRSAGPFVHVNCAAIPETLIEAELFGFVRGAFTDARASKPGLIREAHTGTIFLDEIGLLPVTVQGKLLTALDERTVRRLGSTESEPVDVFVVSASNLDLAAAVTTGGFRADLYHRLAVLTVTVP